MNNEISIKLKSKTDLNKINFKIRNFIIDKVEKEKLEQTMHHFKKTIEDLIAKSQNVADQGGVMKFERSIEINGIKLNIIGDFSPNKTILEKIFSFFK